jgi:hypothetical protein
MNALKVLKSERKEVFKWFRQRFPHTTLSDCKKFIKAITK